MFARLTISHSGLSAYCIQCKKMLTVAVYQIERQNEIRAMPRIGMVSFSRMTGSGSSTFSNIESKENGSQISEILESEKNKTKEEAGGGDSAVDDNFEFDANLGTAIKHYERGKLMLAKMMGEDVETFTENKVQAAIRYLLPSHLFAKDARPLFKHPSELINATKYARMNQFDKEGRPTDSSFYTGVPNYHNLIYNIYKNMDKLNDGTATTSNLPSKETENSLLTRWVNHKELVIILNEKVSETQYDTVLHRLKKVACHPESHNVQEFLRKYQKVVSVAQKTFKVTELDENGYSIAMGYRKTAIAEVKVKEGSGTITVNDQPMHRYFPRVEDRQQLLFPFLVIDQVGRYDVDASTIGGGIQGQCGAIRLGISRALMSFSDSYHSLLDDAGLLIRDSRIVERKKPGQLKARKKFTWVKR